ncbi:MAG: GTP-binding protein [Bacteroidales bacterium]|nr:GTP-binding protein [Bacteroidales bacterium]
MTPFSSKAYLDMELLRFTTAGSVDDGKSTLIGRLLYDTKSIFEDQLEAVMKASVQKGNEYINLALFTDGLRSEREQGITIDVAYRYFQTPKRKFIIADTPGHIQYTRNMVTGASTANATIVLIDARNGVIEQTQRHAYIAHLLGIPELIVCINKMDLVSYSNDRFNEIVSSFKIFASGLSFSNIYYVPISALKGDNVVDLSSSMPWYQGGSLLNLLEAIPVGITDNSLPARFSVQYVIRPFSDQYHDYRAYAGRMESGCLKPGDAVVVLPQNIPSRIKDIVNYKEHPEMVFSPQSVSILLEDDIDISRGDVIVRRDEKHPSVSQEIEVMLCWMNPAPMKMGAKYIVRQGLREARVVLRDFKYKVDVNTLNKLDTDKSLSMNEIACVILKSTKALVFDPYTVNRHTGSIILIDEATNETVGAGMINQ